jgi:signal transduction histidine kinase
MYGRLKPVVRDRKPQTRMTWVLFSVMVGVSGVLALLQYNWTDRLRRSEAEQLRVNLRVQLRQMNRAWTAELNEAWREMRPSGKQLAENGRQAYAARYLEWLAREGPPLFSRVGLDTGEADAPHLLAINATNGRFESWDPGNHTFGRFEVPGASPQEWMAFELNRDYFTRTWLPELIHTWITGAGTDLQVRVRTADPQESVIYDSQPARRGGQRPPLVTADMFPIRGSRSSRVGEGEHRWVIEVRNQTGSLDAAVSASRWRNFGVACILIAMILGAGCALVSYTLQSRRLAVMQFRFIAGVSHEMRTPLTVIRGAGQNLAAGVVRNRKDVDMYARMIVKHADQLGETIEQVLLFAAAKTHESHASDTVSLAGALDDAVEAASVDVAASGCELRVQVSPELPPVLGDAAALRKAFQNLISNAARHGGAGGWIGVSAEPLEVDGRPMVQVKVEDRGPGIPEAELPRIFEPFYRGERTRVEQIRGTGLGLSLLQEIVKAHGGTVGVRSDPGGGTEFSVRLPAIMGNPDACANPAN